MHASVALVGAYERDNFGDLLFALVAPRLFDEEVTLTAPFPGRVDELIGDKVVLYGPLFERGGPDIVWVAGGEVGASSLRGWPSPCAKLYRAIPG